VTTTSEQVFDPRKSSNERRVHKRNHCGISAAMRERGRSGDLIKLLDISESGCSLEGGPILGGYQNPIWVKLPGRSTLKARFCWTNGERTGLAFDEPLHSAVLDNLLSRDRQPETPPAPVAKMKDAVADGVTSSRREQIRLGYAEAPLLKRKSRPADRPFNELITRRERRTVDQRRKARYPAEYASGPDFLEVDGEDMQLRDLASNGIGVIGEIDTELMEIGLEVSVDIADCDPIPARIVWIRSDRMGLSMKDEAIILSASNEG